MLKRWQCSRIPNNLDGSNNWEVAWSVRIQQLDKGLVPSFVLPLCVTVSSAALPERENALGYLGVES